MDDIPLLDDIVTETDANHSNENQSCQEHPHKRSLPQTKSTNEHKANPFLPYEHLAKLALERERFTQSIEAFTENLKHENAHRERVPATQNSSSSHKNDAIVQAITNKVLKQLKPVIEEKIAAELSLYFDEILDDY